MELIRKCRKMRKSNKHHKTKANKKRTFTASPVLINVPILICTFCDGIGFGVRECRVFQFSNCASRPSRHRAPLVLLRRNRFACQASKKPLVLILIVYQHRQCHSVAVTQRGGHCSFVLCRIAFD